MAEGATARARHKENRFGTDVRGQNLPPAGARVNSQKHVEPTVEYNDPISLEVHNSLFKNPNILRNS